MARIRLSWVAFSVPDADVGTAALSGDSTLAATGHRIQSVSAALMATATASAVAVSGANEFRAVVSWLSMEIPSGATIRTSGSIALSAVSSVVSSAGKSGTYVPIGGLIRVAGDEPIAWSVFHDILLWQLTRTAPNDIIFTANRTASTEPIIVTRQAVDL